MRVALLLAFGALLWGCQSAPVRAHAPDDDPASRETPAESDRPRADGTMPFATRRTTIWIYLKEKYDRDGDGAIVLAEYERDTESFHRLDHDHDGRLTPDDFQHAGRMVTMVAQMSVMLYMQADDDPRALAKDEMQTGFDRCDADGDGELSEAEFAAARETAKTERPMPRGMKPYAALLEVVDTDGSGTVSKQELLVFFDARDEDGDGVWQRRPRRGDAERAKAGVPEGDPAPDFTLRDPEGGGAVTLSGFRGARPVALIFGSYT